MFDKWFWLRLLHRLGYHHWTEWCEFGTDHGMFLYRYCQGCKRVEWSKW